MHQTSKTVLLAQRRREEAAHFFEWCRHSLKHHLETLDATDRKQFEMGKRCDKLLIAVRGAWSDYLKTYLPWEGHLKAVRKALPNQKDYDSYMNCSMHLLEKLPKRIKAAVAREEKRRLKEVHHDFFAEAGDARLENYLCVWQSQTRAISKLMIQASGYKCKEGGGASIGDTEVDLEHMLLSEAEATGSAMKVRALLPFIRSLWEKDKTIFVKKAKSPWQPTATDRASGLERRVVPNPEMSETRLNRFLIKLGRALAATDKRRELPDWNHMDQTLRFIIHGWCESIVVDGESWPILCFLTTPALAKFLALCTPRRWQSSRDPRTLERAIARHGLIRIQKGRIQNIEKKGNNLYLPDSATPGWITDCRTSGRKFSITCVHEKVAIPERLERSKTL